MTADTVGWSHGPGEPVTTDRHYVNEGDPIGPDLMREWCTGRNVTVWAITEGMSANAGPITCCAGLDALAFTDAMSAAKVFAQVDLLPCCQNPVHHPDDEIGCIRDSFDDQPETVLVTLRNVAAHHGIEWPDDIAGPT